MAEVVEFRTVSLLNEEGRTVFQDLDWSLATGARVRIQTEAGSGASALLRLAAGLAHPQKGSVWLDGVPLGPYAFDHPFLKRGGIGWVPTEGGLLANLSLTANLALPLRFLRKKTQVEAEEMAAEALDASGLSARAPLRPHALEPRERWLGALVRAALTNPRLWLVDQPPGPLESPARRAAERLLGEVASDAIAALLVVGGGWKGLETEVFHLEAGRLVPGGV